jgi:hypothetical protein
MLAVLCFPGAFALNAQVITPSPVVKTTGIVGIAFGETAQLNLLNPGVEPPAAGTSCTASVSFVDAAGTVLKSTSLTVVAGQSQSFALRSDIDLSLVSGARRDIRATITLPGILPPTSATTTTTDALIPACRLIPTLEILDTITGRTLVVLGHADRVHAASTTAP